LLAGHSELALMNLALDALYKQNDPTLAVTRFQEVLARNAEHYGANFQLAKALDLSGKPEAALTVWKRVLLMANAVQDTTTARIARQRIDGNPHE